jgi:hypothetical protein
MMEHITQKNCIKLSIADREGATIKRQVIDRRFQIIAYIESYDPRSKDSDKMVRYESVPASNVQHVCTWRKHTSYFECHVVCASDLAPPLHAF